MSDTETADTVVVNNGGSNGQLDEVRQLVVGLRQAVEEMRQGTVDEETVRRMMAETLAASRREYGSGFTPDDRIGEHAAAILSRRGLDRAEVLHQAVPERIAPLLRRPPADVRHFQRTADRLLILAAMTKQRPTELQFYDEEYVPALRQVDPAMDTKTVGEGKEWVPVELSRDIIERVEVALQVVALFPVVDMPTNPFEFPTKGARKHLGVLPEAVDAGTPKAKKLVVPTGGKITLTANKLAGEIVVSKELEEDSAIAVLPTAEEELVDWLAHDLEYAVIAGDTAATPVEPDDPIKLWDGIIKLTPAAAKVDLMADAEGLDPKALLKLRALMGKYGLSPAELRYIISINGYFKLLGSDLLMTPDKYPGATLESGELGRIWGVPVLVSEYLADAVGGTPSVLRSTAIAVNRRAYMRGIRRNTTVQVLRELYAESDQDAVLVTTRQAFTARWPGEPASAVATNVDVALAP